MERETWNLEYQRASRSIVSCSSQSSLPCTSFTFLNLGNMAFLGADEPRYARIGEEMLRTADFVTPTLNSRPWLEKPPLLFWMEALSFGLFGVSEVAARFPVALLGLLAALGCSYLLYRVQGRRAALLGLLILSTSPLFFVYLSCRQPGYASGGPADPLPDLRLSGTYDGAPVLGTGCGCLTGAGHPWPRGRWRCCLDSECSWASGFCGAGLSAAPCS